jgi:hypothetical protein
MDQQADPQWLTWTKRLQAIAQTWAYLHP